MSTLIAKSSLLIHLDPEAVKTVKSKMEEIEKKLTGISLDRSLIPDSDRFMEFAIRKQLQGETLETLLTDFGAQADKLIELSDSGFLPARDAAPKSARKPTAPAKTSASTSPGGAGTRPSTSDGTTKVTA